MKQHITEKQWLEIKPKEQRLLIVAVNNTNQLLTIGQMIEFLGDDLKKIDINPSMKEDFVILRADINILGNNKISIILKDWKYAVDGCFKAVKYKLNNK